MEVHGSGPESLRKEITCRDCGHLYVIAQGQPSARCTSCGNIEYFAATQLSSFSQAIAKRVLPRLPEKAPPADPLLPFRATPDGIVVENLRMKYQVEWQLWAALVKNFQDPAHHMAYVCQAAAARELERAAQRYREHRSVMALLADSRWQADVAELMLSRIETLSIMGMQREAGQGWTSQLPLWFLKAQTESRAMRYLWLTMGVVVMVKVYSLVWWK